MSNQILLIGGGHAHLAVLERFARRHRTGIEVTLVSTQASTVYSGMLPGHLAGHYTLAECSIPLDPVCETAKADFVRGRVVRLDLNERIAVTDGGAILPFDVVSIDTGSAPDTTLIPGLDHTVAVRPIDPLLSAWQTLEKRFSGTPLTQTLAVLGGGPAGTELIAALAYRARQANVNLKSSIVTGHGGLLPGQPEAARASMHRRLTALGVRVIEADAAAVRPNAVTIRGAGEFYADLIISALGAGAALWPYESGLKCDEHGFIEVNRHLQSVSHPFVFAAGDCASMVDHPYPKSGVYALRAGRPLAENLLRAVMRRRLLRFGPQKRALYLLSTGDKEAIGIWGPFTVEGPRVWQWKDRIDRKFIRRFNPRA